MLFRNYKSPKDLFLKIKGSSVVKKEDNSIKWEKVGNKNQFKFNQSVEAKFDSAISAIEKKKVDKAQKKPEEVLSTAALSVRQAALLPRSLVRRGTYLACGLEGHWRNNCPNLISSGRSDKSTK